MRTPARSWTVAVATGVAVLTLSGCGADDGPGRSPVGGDEPTTPRALAYVVSEVLGEPSAASPEDDAAEEFAGDVVSTEVRFAASGEYDAQLVTIAVGEGLAPAVSDCDDDATEFCEVTSWGTLRWEPETPEEDPGVVYLVVAKGDVDVLIFTSGPPVTGDPREIDLPIDVEALVELAQDPRVDLTTSAEAVEAGRSLSWWVGS